MKSASGAYIQGYNGQAAVDSEKQVIVACPAEIHCGACDLTGQAADAPHYPGMIEQVAQNTGGIPAGQSAGAGYFSQANIQSQTNPFVTVLIPPDKLKHGNAALDNVPPPDIPDGLLNLADRMRRQLSTPNGRKAYAWRKKTVEPVFGQIKGCPGSPGFTQFLRRGLKKTRPRSTAGDLRGAQLQEIHAPQTRPCGCHKRVVATKEVCFEPQTGSGTSERSSKNRFAQIGPPKNPKLAKVLTRRENIRGQAP